MKNYKIINTHTNEIIKALNDLGYFWTPKKFDEQDCLLKAHWILTEQSGAITYSSGTMIDYPLNYQELTLPQLRDLVVLHRNDLNDRTHVYTTPTGEDLSAILLGDWWHIFTGGSWQKFTHKDSEKSLLMDRIQPEPEQGLISGADALRALADGEDVECQNKETLKWFDCKVLSVCELVEGSCLYRIKPRVITLSLEIPAPFEPKDGEEAWCLDGATLKGYKKVIFDDFDLGLGFWHTEEEIKQVVAALRRIKG